LSQAGEGGNLTLAMRFLGFASLLVAGWTWSPAAPARAAGPAALELPFPFPVHATLSVPDTATPELLDRFRGVRGLSLEIRAAPGRMLRDALVRGLEEGFPRADKRVVIEPPFKAAHMDQLRRLGRLEVEVLHGLDALTPLDRRLLEGLGPVRVVHRLPAGFTGELWDQARGAKHALLAIELGPAGLDPARWALLLRNPNRHRRFVLQASHPPAGVYPLTQVAPLSLEVRTARDQLPAELLAVLQDLRGVDLCLVVDGRLTREHLAAWDRLERFRLKVEVEGPGEITPGLAALLARVGPR